MNAETFANELVDRVASLIRTGELSTLEILGALAFVANAVADGGAHINRKQNEQELDEQG